MRPSCFALSLSAIPNHPPVIGGWPPISKADLGGAHRPADPGNGSPEGPVDTGAGVRASVGCACARGGPGACPPVRVHTCTHTIHTYLLHLVFEPRTKGGAWWGVTTASGVSGEGHGPASLIPVAERSVTAVSRSTLTRPALAPPPPGNTRLKGQGPGLVNVLFVKRKSDYAHSQARQAAPSEIARP